MKKLLLLATFFISTIGYSQAINDECSGRTTISVETSNYQQYTANMATATESLDASCNVAGNNNLDLWYEFTMPVSGNLRVTNIGGLVGATLYDACGGTEIACFYGDNFVHNLTSGQIYVLRIAQRDIYAGNVNFRVQAFATPINDECSGRTAITVETANYLQYTANTATATESVDASCNNASLDNLDLWYEFTMPVSGNLRVTNIGGLVNATLYDACGGTEIACFYGDDFVYNIASGQIYVLRIAQREIYAGNVNFRVQAFATPINDDCSGRTAITVETANYLQYTANTATATESLDASCESAGNNNLDLWYEFTMPVTGNLRVTNIGGLANATLYDACGGTEIACFNGDNFVYNLTSGQIYVLRIAQRSIYSGNVNFRLQAFATPINDECSGRTAITVETANYLEYSANTASATESLDASCETAGNNNLDLWYEFTMPVTGNLRVTNIGGLVNATLYDACGGTEIACFNGDNFVYNLTSGQIYVLRIAQRSIYSGNVNFRLQAFEAAENDECLGSTNIDVTTELNSYTYNTSSATESLDSSCDNAGNNNLDVWYNFTMPVNGNVRITNISLLDGATLYSSCGGAEIVCFYNNGFLYNLSATNTYYLRMSKRSIYSGEVTFNIQAFETAANDECANALNIAVPTVSPSQYNASFPSATNSLDSSCDNASNENLDLWYAFTMPVNGTLELTNINLLVGATLYDACGGNELSCFYNNGNFFNLTSGTSYVLRLSMRQIYASNISFKVKATAAPLQPCSGTTEFSAGVWNNGEPNETTNAIIRSNYNTETYGSFTACSLSIDTGVNLTVSAGDYVEVSFGINVSGFLNIEHEGSVVQRDAASTTINNGAISVKVTTPFMDAKEFMVMGSPVSEETRNDVLNNAYRVAYHLTENFVPNPDVATSFPNAENFADDNYDNWVENPTNLNAGEGYIVFPQPDNTSSGTYNLNFNNGTLNTGDITFNVKYNTPGPTAEDDKNASPNILANPYPSAISADDFINTNTMVDEVYFWEHITLPSPLLPGAAAMNFSMEDISMYNLMGGIAAASDATGTETIPNGFISTGQGFGIKATAAGTATFTNTMRRVYNNNTLRRPSQNENERILLKLSNNENNLQSTTLIGFSENATSGIDSGYDSRRIASVVSLFSHLEIGNEEFGIQSREPFDPSIKIVLGFSSMVDENSEYTISLANLEGPNLANVNTFLIDNLNNTITNLNEADYTFKAEKGTYLKRFTLQFIETVLGAEDYAKQEILVFPNPTSNVLNIYSEKATVSKIEIYDIQGKKVMQRNFNNENQSQIDFTALQAGIYLCKIYSDGTIINKKIIKK